MLRTLCGAFAAMMLIGAPVSAQTPPIDCSSGCFNVTCGSDENCTLWRCDGGSDCSALSRFAMPMSVESTEGIADRPPETVYFKTCPQRFKCDLFELSSAGAQLIGTYDDIEAIADAHRAQRSNHGTD